MGYRGLNSGVAARRAVDVVPASSRRGSRKRIRAGELELKLAALQRDYIELHAALVEAAQVHRRLCAPRLVQYDDFEIASETFAVRHVAGDFFTIKNTGRGAMLALSDICGKGLAAGMWTTYLAGLIASHTNANPEPESIAAGVNRDLCRMSLVAPLASLFLANLDPGTGLLDYCSAGHPPALLLRANGEMEKLSEGGPLLGVVAEATFVRGSVELRRGDILLAFSDGITESCNHAEQEFGYDSLEAHLRQAQNGSADAVLFSVLGAVQDFAAASPLVDDMSLVVIKHCT